MDINFILNDIRLQEGDRFQNKNKNKKEPKKSKDQNVNATPSTRKKASHPNYISTYTSRISPLIKKEVDEAIGYVVNILEAKKENTLPKSPWNFHKLTGGGYSFKATNEMVVVLFLFEDLMVLYEIGHHNAIPGYYGKDGKSMNLDGKANQIYNKYR